MEIKTERRTERINFAVSLTEKKQIEEYAKENCISISELIRFATLYFIEHN